MNKIWLSFHVYAVHAVRYFNDQCHNFVAPAPHLPAAVTAVAMETSRVSAEMALNRREEKLGEEMRFRERERERERETGS